MFFYTISKHITWLIKYYSSVETIFSTRTPSSEILLHQAVKLRILRQKIKVGHRTLPINTLITIPIIVAIKPSTVRIITTVLF